MTGYEVLWTRRSGSIHSCQASPVYRGCIAAMLQQGSGVLYRLLDSGEAAESQGRQCLGTGRAEGIWDIPGVFWRRWQWFPPRGSSWVRAGSSPQLRVWEGECGGGQTLASASARRRGARCPWVTLRRKGGPRAAPTGPGVGAALAGAEGGLGVSIRPEETD